MTCELNMKTSSLLPLLALSVSLTACGGDEDPILTAMGGMSAPTGATTAPIAGMSAPVAGMSAPVAGMSAPVAGMSAPMAGVETPTAGVEDPMMGGVEAPLPTIPVVEPVDCTGASAEAPCAVSMQQARSLDIVPAETVVQVEGIVSATRLNEEGATSHIVIQAEGGGPLSGIWTYVNDARIDDLMVPAEGQRVRVTALTADYYGQRQLQKIEALEILGSAVVPVPVVLPPEQLATMSELGPYFEGVLVAVEGVEVLELNPAAGPGDSDPTNEFVVTGGLRVDDYLTQHSAQLALPAVGERFARIVGVLRLANNDLKIEPRYAADLSR